MEEVKGGLRQIRELLVLSRVHKICPNPAHMRGEQIAGTWERTGLCRIPHDVQGCIGHQRAKELIDKIPEA